MTVGERRRQSAVARRAGTGVRPEEYAAVERAVVPRLAGAAGSRRQRPARSRAVGAGHPVALSPRDQVLVTVVWLRRSPTHDVLALLFDLGAATTVGRTIARVLPVLAAAGVGLATMRRPDPRRRQQRTRDALRTDTPALAVVFDPFAQRVPRPTTPAERDHCYSAKQQAQTIKPPVGVDADSGPIIAGPASVPGPTADRTVRARSGVLTRLPAAVGGIGDLAYGSIQRLHPGGLGATPRRTPRGRERPPEDIASNRACARRRIVGAHRIGRRRHDQCRTQRDRPHRRRHPARVRAVAGVVIARSRSGALPGGSGRRARPHPPVGTGAMWDTLNSAGYLLPRGQERPSTPRTY